MTTTTRISQRIVAVLSGLAMMIGLAACGSSQTSESQESNTNPTTVTESGPQVSKSSQVLVAYFSGSGHTKSVAEHIADETGGTLFEITPETPYTSDDLDWTDSSSRVNREHDDEAQRDIKLATTTPDNWTDYDTVFIGYPIWWAIAAWPVNNFVADNDFTGKTVIPFATSTSSSLGDSVNLLKKLTTTGDWKEGQRFASSASADEVAEWVKSLNL